VKKLIALGFFHTKVIGTSRNEDHVVRTRYFQQLLIFSFVPMMLIFGTELTVKADSVNTKGTMTSESGSGTSLQHNNIVTIYSTKSDSNSDSQLSSMTQKDRSVSVPANTGLGTTVTRGSSVASKDNTEEALTGSAEQEKLIGTTSN